MAATGCHLRFNRSTSTAPSSQSAHGHNKHFPILLLDSYSKLPQKTTSLEAYRKRKTLTDALRELEQEKTAQQVNAQTPNAPNTLLLKQFTLSYTDLTGPSPLLLS